MTSGEGGQACWLDSWVWLTTETIGWVILCSSHRWLSCQTILVHGIRAIKECCRRHCRLVIRNVLLCFFASEMER